MYQYFRTYKLTIIMFNDFIVRKRVQFLTLWTPEDGIPTFRQRQNGAKLRYTVRTASYQARRPTVYHRYGS